MEIVRYARARLINNAERNEALINNLSQKASEYYVCVFHLNKYPYIAATFLMMTTYITFKHIILFSLHFTFMFYKMDLHVSFWFRKRKCKCAKSVVIFTFCIFNNTWHVSEVKMLSRKKIVCCCTFRNACF